MNIEQERNKLLPCPFCGCSMSMSAVARDWWRVAGDHDDDCILHDQRHDAPQADDQKQLLIEAWNRRAALQSQHDEETKNLRKALWVANGAIGILQKKLEALQSQDREDAERMDWLESVGSVDIVRTLDNKTEVYAPHNDLIYAAAGSLRAAIDHARRAEGDGE